MERLCLLMLEERTWQQWVYEMLRSSAGFKMVGMIDLHPVFSKHQCCCWIVFGSLHHFISELPSDLVLLWFFSVWSSLVGVTTYPSIRFYCSPKLNLTFKPVLGCYYLALMYRIMFLGIIFCSRQKSLVFLYLLFHCFLLYSHTNNM